MACLASGHVLCQKHPLELSEKVITPQPAVKETPVSERACSCLYAYLSLHFGKSQAKTCYALKVAIFSWRFTSRPLHVLDF